MRGSSIIFIGLLCGCVIGCNSVNANTSHPKVADAVEDVLPRDVAGPPETIPIPSKRTTAVIMASRDGASIHITSRMRWHGKVVHLYYLPAHNIYHHGEQVELQSAQDVQRIGSVPIGPDGHWATTWNARNLVPLHRPFFLLAQTDRNDTAIIQINTVN